MLFFLPDPGAALRAWVELLRPGGRLGVATFGTQDPRWRALDRVFAPYLPPGLADARTSGASGPFASDAGVEGLLSAAGLTGVRTVRRSLSAVFRDPSHLLAFSWSHGQRVMWEAVPEDERPAEQERFLDLAAALQPPAGGPILLEQDVRYTVGRRPG